MASKTALKTREKGAGSIYKEGKRWYLKVRVSGKSKATMLRNEDGTACTTEKDAIAAADGYRKILFAEDKEEMALQIAEAKKLRKQLGVTLGNAWDLYLKQPDRHDTSNETLHNHAFRFADFVEWMQKEHPEKKLLTDVDSSHAKEYLAALWKRGISARTYNAYVQLLCMVFKYLMEPAALEKNPFEGIQKKVIESYSRRAFTSEQVAAIFRGFDEGFFYETEVEKLTTGRKRERVIQRLEYKPMHAEEMRVLLNLCCWTGCRGQDGCLMQWKNVDLNRGIISFIPRKTAKKTGNRAVSLPMHPNLKVALTEALSWKNSNVAGEDYIIPKVAHRYLYNHSGVQKDVMKIIRCATGLETTAAKEDTIGRRKLAANAYSLHSFRHTFVSFCANTGIPLAIVAEIVGHGNPAMTEHYSHITTEAKRGAINALPVLSTASQLSGEGIVKEETDTLREKVTCAISRAKPEELEKILKIFQTV